ncbi:MAG TPA: hypothetical protein VG537_06830 [Candidatus Kapabacteria bacterium]|nr:hypothetical protein [Candidatus Kapabacteria bacterium]
MIRYLLALPILFFALAVYGQRAASVAPFVSFDFGSPLFINRAPGALNRFFSVDTGTSSCFSYGFGAEAAIGQIGPIGFIGGMEGIYSTGKFTGRDTIAGQEWKLNAEAEIEWKPSAISIRGGPWVSARLSGTVWDRGADVTSSSTLSSPVHYGIVAGLAWQIANGPLRSELNAHLDLTELPNAGVNAYSFGISLAYSIGNVAASDDVEQVSTRSNPTQPERVETHPTTRVQFLVDGIRPLIDLSLQRAEIKEKQFTLLRPGFSLGSAHFLSKEEATHFSYASLANKAADSIQADLLNIVAYRLAENPTALLYLSSNASERSILTSYFDSVWQIVPSRLIFSIEEDKSGTIEVFSPDPNITAPLVTQWVLQSFHLPHLAISSEIGRDAKGTLTLKRDGMVLVRYSDLHAHAIAPFEKASVLNFDTTIDLDHDRRWQEGISKLNATDTNRIIAELLQQDHDGYASFVYDTLLLPSLNYAKKPEMFVQSRYRFSFFEGARKNPDEDKNIDLLLDRMMSVIEPGTRVTLIASKAESSLAPTYLERKVLDRIHKLNGKITIQHGNPTDEGEEGTVLVIID